MTYVGQLPSTKPMRSFFFFFFFFFFFSSSSYGILRCVPIGQFRLPLSHENIPPQFPPFQNRNWMQ